jgi:hypothetical protein
MMPFASLTKEAEMSIDDQKMARDHQRYPGPRPDASDRELRGLRGLQVRVL